MEAPILSFWDFTVFVATASTFPRLEWSPIHASANFIGQYIYPDVVRNECSLPGSPIPGRSDSRGVRLPGSPIPGR